MRFSTLLILACLALGSYSQPTQLQGFNKNFTPSRKYNLDANGLAAIDYKYDSLIKNVDFPDKKSKKLVKESISHNKKKIKSLDSADLLMWRDTISRYLQGLTEKIQKRNPILKDKKISVFTYRTDIPNATNRGAGVIFINLDLITKLNDEAQMSFIISHELSHDIKGHIMASLLKTAELEYNEEYKKEFKKIMKQDYKRYKGIEALLLKYMSKYMEHSRSHELQADSLGLVFYANAGYPAESAFKTILILDSVDAPVYTSKIDYMKYFNFPSYPFKKSWLEAEAEESIGGNVASMKLPDSLKTHPDCKIRAEELKKEAKSINFLNNGTRKDIYDYYRTLAEFESLEYLQQDFELSNGLYTALQLLNIYPDNIYLKCSVVNILYELQRSQTEHYFSGVADFPDKTFCESYNQMLVFLHNTNSEIVKTLAIQYFNTNLKNASSSPFAGYVAILLKSLETPKEEKVKLIAAYQSKYTDEYYIKLLEKKFKPKK